MAAKDRGVAMAAIKDYFGLRTKSIDYLDRREAKMLLTRACALIDRLAPEGSEYVKQKDAALRVRIAGTGDTIVDAMHLGSVEAVLEALHDDYDQGNIEPPPEVGIGPLKRIVQILTKFHKVARKLARRHAGRKPLKIADEYDVQDLIKGLFSIDFDDVRAEEWTPSYAGSGGKRMDLLFKDHDIVVEVKKTRDNLKDKGIGEELTIDIAHYKEHANCRTLVCFVYDPDQLIFNPTGLKRDLECQSTSVLAVSVIVCQG